MVSLKKYQTYESFRATEDVWLNSLPADWKLSRLQFGSSIRNSGVDKKIVEGEELIKLCNYVDVYYHDIIDDSIDFMEASATPEEIKNFRLRKGDVIMTKDSESPDDIGIPAYVSKDFDDVICGYHLCVLKTFRDKLDPKFLFYFLKSTFAQSKFEIYSNGVTRFGLSYNGIKTLPVPVPSLKEQEFIANFLDQKTKQIDELIEQKEKLLQLLTEKRTAIITQAVTKGLDHKAKMKDSGIEWLGEVPEHWEVIKLKYVASYNDESLDETTDSDYEIKYVDISSVSLTGGISHFEDLTFEKAPSRARRIVRQGDTIISTVRTYLKAICYLEKIPDNTIVSTGFAVIRTRNPNDYNSRFLGYCLQDERLIGDIMAYSVGVSYPAINAWDLAQLTVTRPPISEQLRICQFLDNQIKRLDHLSNNIHNSILGLQEYRTSLISSTVTGQIDVRKEVVA